LNVARTRLRPISHIWNATLSWIQSKTKRKTLDYIYMASTFPICTSNNIFVVQAELYGCNHGWLWFDCSSLIVEHGGRLFY
jgi:hypothetical protein